MILLVATFIFILNTFSVKIHASQFDTPCFPVQIINFIQQQQFLHAAYFSEPFTSPQSCILSLQPTLHLKRPQPMHKYDGQLIHQSFGDDGILEVIESNGMISLHFGTLPKQSTMRLDSPNTLQLPYVRAMSTWLLFKEPTIEDALLIGLGGGSLTRHLLQNTPSCRLKVVEYRRDVVNIARSHFDLPMDPRLKIIIGDGAQYIRQRTDSHSNRYDILFIDAFDESSMAESIRNEAFFDACKAIMKSDGMMIINLWGGTNNPDFQQVALWLGRIFDWKILFIPVQDRGNIIGLAFNNQTPVYHLKALRLRAAALEQHYRIEFPVFLRDLVKHNTSVINNVIRK